MSIEQCSIRSEKKKMGEVTKAIDVHYDVSVVGYSSHQQHFIMNNCLLTLM